MASVVSELQKPSCHPEGAGSLRSKSHEVAGKKPPRVFDDIVESLTTYTTLESSSGTLGSSKFLHHLNHMN